MRKFATKKTKVAKLIKISRSLCKKGHRPIKKSTSPPVGAVVTNIRYAHEDMAMMATTMTVIAKWND